MNMTPEKIATLKAEIVSAEAVLRAAVADRPLPVMLAAMFHAYVNLATEAGQREKAGELMVSVGGQILLEQFLQKSPARMSVEVAGAAEYHEAPPTVQ